MSRSSRKEERRVALLQGAREVLTEHGLEGFTTGRIAKAAGIAQSGFYVYFEDRDACLRAVAAEVGDEILTMIRETRLAATDVSGLPAAYAGALNAAVVHHRATTELFLRFRREPGPLGDVFRALLDRAFHELRTDMVAAGQAGDDPRGERLARYVLVGVLGAIETLLDGDIDDIDAVANDFALISAGVLAMEGVR